MTEDTPITRYSQIRRAVIASVIAAVLVIIFIQPLLRFVWSTLLVFGPRFVKAFVDSIYRSAAMGHRNHVDVMVLMIFFAFVSGSSLGASLSCTKRLLKPTEKMKPTSKRRALVSMWAAVVMLHICALGIVIPPFADLQHNTSFRQRLAVLAPKLTENEEEELEAQWAMMRNRGDFDAIKERMEALAIQHGIELPPTLLK